MIGNITSDKSTMPFPGKIAVITSNPSHNEDDYRSVDHLVAKYGTDKVLHRIWPSNFIADREQIFKIFV